jgi:antitoxin MazE
MRAAISKWGNSLGVRIPKFALEGAHLAEGDYVDVSVENGKLVLVRNEDTPSLDELISMITPENRHGESSEVLVGKEIW